MGTVSGSDDDTGNNGAQSPFETDASQVAGVPTKQVPHASVRRACLPLRSEPGQ